MPFMEFVDWIETHGGAVRDLLLGAHAAFENWRLDPNSLPNRLNRFWRVIWLLMVALTAFAVVGALARNAWLISVPILLIMVLVDLFLAFAINSLRPITTHADRKTKPPFNEWRKLTKEEKKEWKKEYSAGGALKLIEQGIQGRLFWIALTVTWAFITRPWQGGWLGATSFAVLLLFWTFNHLCKFLGTLRIASKIIMFVFVILLLIGSLVQKTNNPLILSLKGKLDYWSSRTEVNRVFDKQRAKANHVIAQGVATPIQDSVFLVAPGAPLRGESGVIKYYAGTPLHVLRASDQKDQPKVLLGTHWRCYLPDESLTEADEKDVPTISSQTTKDFLLDNSRLVWVNVDYLSPVVEVKQPPKLKVLKPGEATNLTGIDDSVNSSKQSSGSQKFLAAGGKIRWWPFVVLTGLIVAGWLACKKWVKNKTALIVCNWAAVILICMAAWNYVIGPFGQAALAGDGNDIQQKQSILKVADGEKSGFSLTPDDHPQYGGEIIKTSSQELVDGLELRDGSGQLVTGPCRIYWHQGSVIRNRAKNASPDTLWAGILPYGSHRLDTSGNIKRFACVGRFKYSNLPAYCIVVYQDGQISAWPKDDKIVVGLGIEKIVLRVNTPLKQETWGSDYGSIVLEVVKQ